MAWTLVQHTSAQPGGSSSSDSTLAFGSNNTAGNLLVAAFTTFSASAITLTVTDTAGNTWSQIGSYVVNGSQRVSLWLVSSCLTGANTIHVRPNISCSLDLAIVEYGGDGAGATPGTAATGTGTSTAPSCGTITVGSNAMVIAAVNHNAAGGATAGSGWTRIEQQTSQGQTPIAVEDQLGISSNVTGDWSVGASTAWAAIGVAFAPAADILIGQACL